MSWVCPMCSTNNEDSESKCIVCEYERASDRICTLTFNKVQKLCLSGDVVVPKEFNVIGEGAFKGRTDIYSVTLHDQVRKIAKEAFSGCSNLRSVICECEIQSVGIRAFAECTSLMESARVKAKYVAKDAYHITPKPTYTPPPPPSKTPFVETTSVERVSYNPENTGRRIAAWLVLLGVGAMLLPLVILIFILIINAGISLWQSVIA